MGSVTPQSEIVIVGSSVEWLLADQQQSVRRVTSARGADIADFDYDSYGKVTSPTGPASIDLLFGYTGMQFDQETGLECGAVRYYSANLGRF